MSTRPARPAPNPAVRTVLLVLLVAAAIVLAVLGWIDHSLNPDHVLSAAVICVAVAVGLLTW